MFEERLVDVVRELEAAGYPNLLASLPHGIVRCARCGTETPAGQWSIAEVRRLEGESDPSEEVIVLGLVGPESPCGCKGSLVLGYGPSASPEDASVLAALDVPSAARRPEVGHTV